MSEFKVVMRFLGACGPATLPQIERELLVQCCKVKTEKEAMEQAVKAIEVGVKAGLICAYDEESWDCI